MVLYPLTHAHQTLTAHVWSSRGQSPTTSAQSSLVPPLTSTRNSKFSAGRVSRNRTNHFIWDTSYLEMERNDGCPLLDHYSQPRLTLWHVLSVTVIIIVGLKGVAISLLLGVAQVPSLQTTSVFIIKELIRNLQHGVPHFWNKVLNFESSPPFWSKYLCPPIHWAKSLAFGAGKIILTSHL